MRLVIDIGHPAHVHVFKNFIWMMESKGHDCLITVNEKEIACDLLDNYGFQYVNHGAYGKSIIRKFFNLPVMLFKLYRTVDRFHLMCFSAWPLDEPPRSLFSWGK